MPLPPFSFSFPPRNSLCLLLGWLAFRRLLRDEPLSLASSGLLAMAGATFRNVLHSGSPVCVRMLSLAPLLLAGARPKAATGTPQWASHTSSRMDKGCPKVRGQQPQPPLPLATTTAAT